MPRTTPCKHAPITIGLLPFILVAVTAGLWVGCTRETSERHSDEIPIASLIAVGDTGGPWGFAPQLFEGQLAVGVAMQREHARSPIDAFVLLGDNFYPTGLLADELFPRILDNIARPYCAFIDASDELAKALDPECADVEGPRPRFYAVIGNHDLDSPNSEQLQRTEVARFVRNWDMPGREDSRIREQPGGLSLIFLNSHYPWGAAEVEQLSADLIAAKGPWRVIVGHRPPIAGHPQLSRMVARASSHADRIVHAYLAGHVHVLAAIPGATPAPALTVIAGSGSHARQQQETEYRIEAPDLIAAKLGFMRVDVLGEPPEQRLRVSLFETPPSAALAFLGHRAIAQYEIQEDGVVARLR